MARRNPVVSRQFLEDFLVKDNLFVFPAYFSESRLQTLPDGPEVARHAGHFVGVLSLPLLAHFNASHGRSLEKEVLNHFWDDATFLGLGGLADDGREIELALRESLQRGIGNAAEVFRVHLLDDALFDELLGHLIMRIMS